MNATVNQIIAGAIGMDERLRRLQRCVVWSEDEECSRFLTQQRTVA